LWDVFSIVWAERRSAHKAIEVSYGEGNSISTTAIHAIMNIELGELPGKIVECVVLLRILLYTLNNS
jgi:hypothetical protein